MKNNKNNEVGEAKTSYRKGDRVCYFNKDSQEYIHATVYKGGALTIRVRHDDGKTGVRGHVSLFKTSLKDTPKSTTKTFHRNDRVEYDSKKEDKTIYGVVAKGGNTDIVIILDGGKYEVKVHAAIVHNSNKPLPKDVPNPMDNYEVKGYKVIHGHDDSEPFRATIYKDGKAILSASNDGWGGGNQYHVLKDTDKEATTKFYADCKAWAVQFGDKKPFEPADTWVTWYQYQRPYGITGEAYVKEYVKELAAIR